MCLPQLGTISFFSVTQLYDILKLIHEIKQEEFQDSGIIFLKEYLYNHGTFRYTILPPYFTP
jgi:hypothetical protein